MASKEKNPNGCGGLACEGGGSQRLSVWGRGGHVCCYDERHLGREMGKGRKNNLGGTARSLGHPTTTLMSCPERAHASKILTLYDVS